MYYFLIPQVGHKHDFLHCRSSLTVKLDPITYLRASELASTLKILEISISLFNAHLPH